jgi:two-component system, NtrC family, sensor kinase
MDRTPNTDDRTEDEGLSYLAALASPVTHEFNNFLNVVMLQAAILQQQVPEKYRDELAALRRQGKGVAGLIQHWQDYRQRFQRPPGPVDLNAVVGRVAATLGDSPAEGVRLATALGPDLPPVLGSDRELGLLVRLLVTNAAAAVADLPGAVTVRTGNGNDGVLLAVEDTGPGVDAAKLPEFFDPLTPARPGTSALELAACETMVRRRLRGRVEPENRPGGGLVVSVWLKPWEG